MHRHLRGFVVAVVALAGVLGVAGDGLALPHRARLEGRIVRPNSALNRQAGWAREQQLRQVVIPGRSIVPGRIRLPDPFGDVGRIPRQLPGRGIHHPQRLPPGVIIVPIQLPHPAGVGDQPLSLPGRGNRLPIYVAPTPIRR